MLYCRDMNHSNVVTLQQNSKPHKPSMESYIDRCWRVTESKGFRPQEQIGLQLMLIASEVAEAMQETSVEISDSNLESHTVIFQDILEEFESKRKQVGYIQDNTKIINRDNLLEELADVCIRVFSFVGAMELSQEFIEGLNKKIEKNKKRPVLHGKGF